MEIIKYCNYALLFFVELGMLASFFLFGMSRQLAMPYKVLLAIAIPIAVAVLWGMFFAPKASIHLAQPWNAMGEYLLFMLAGVALIASGRPSLGIGFTITAVISETISLLLP